jgi:hypothetical protein
MPTHVMRRAARDVVAGPVGSSRSYEEWWSHAIARDGGAPGAVQHPQEHGQNLFDLETASGRRFDLAHGLNRAFRRWLAELDNDLGPGRGIPPGGGTRPGPFRLIRGGAA